MSIEAIKAALESHPHELYFYMMQRSSTDCYGDGNVYRGVRSKDSSAPTFLFNLWVKPNEVKHEH